MKLASGGTFAEIWLALNSAIMRSISAVDGCCSAAPHADATRRRAKGAIKARIIPGVVWKKRPLVNDRHPPHLGRSPSGPDHSHAGTKRMIFTTRWTSAPPAIALAARSLPPARRTNGSHPGNGAPGHRWLFAHPNIKVLRNKAVDRFVGEDGKGLTGVELTDTVTGAKSLEPTQGAFVAIGHAPATELFKGALAMDDSVTCWSNRARPKPRSSACSLAAT
jgi:hypothetical protein